MKIDKNNNMLKYPVTTESLQKKTNDLLYSWLLLKSWEAEKLENNRVLDRNTISVRSIARELYNDERKKDKISENLKKLEELGLVKTIYPEEYAEGNNIPQFILFEKHEPFILIPRSTLEFLAFSGVQDCIKVYAWLSHKYSGRGCCSFTIDEILTNCFQLKGITNAKRRQEINQVLELLSTSGLIKIERINGRYQIIAIEKEVKRGNN